MSDVIEIAQNKRARLMKEIEARMDQVEKLDNFIMFGAQLSTEETHESAETAIAAE
ncbi:MAG: hypothetical protein AAGK37_08300 [Pseudomonadota bacterium]